MGIFPDDRPKPKGLLDAIYNVGSGLYRDTSRAANWFGEQASKPPAEAQADVRNVIKGVLSAPEEMAKGAFGSSEMMRTEGPYDPGPVLEAATLPMGTGAVAGVPLKA